MVSQTKEESSTLRVLANCSICFYMPKCLEQFAFHNF